MWLAFCHSMACQPVTSWKGAPGDVSPSEICSVVVTSSVICFPFCVVWSSILVLKDLAEVCSLSRGVMLATPIHPITGWHLLSPHSFTRYPFGVPGGCLPCVRR